MKKFVTLFILLAALAFFTLAANAGENKIGYIDLQKALNESTKGKEAKVELEATMKKLQGEINTRMAEREKLKTELEKQSLVLSADAKRKKADSLEKLEKEIERMISDSNAEMQKKQRDKEVAILKDLKGIIDDIGKKEGYTIILPSDIILYSNEGIDLTQSLIDRYNAQKPQEQAAPNKK